ncbi:MAG: acyltransferase [Bacteroidia bacterium]|nr:acyltransferase [Bacteroidia bacterium]MCF8428036.1 acyltransferase [Bacteroidia bacterium]
MHLGKLDALRGFAAIYVAIGHWTHTNDYTPEIIKEIFRYGQQAVILFFLLSGFVIYIATMSARRQTFKEYFTKRFRRIYPIMILAFILSFVVAFADGMFAQRFNWGSFIGTSLMLQDYSTGKPGIWFYYFMGNSPLWSLGYEWWFYMLYFVFYKYLNHKPYRTMVAYIISLVSIITYLIFPNHASLVLGYFIIWFSGYEAAHVFFRDKTFTFKNIFNILWMNASILGVIIVYNFAKYKIEAATGITAIPVNKLIIHFGTTFLFLAAGLAWWKVKLIGFNLILGAFTRTASISYAMYVFHFPILAQWNLYKYVDYEITTVNIIWINTLRIVLLVGLSYLAEIKLQPIFNKWFPTR